MIEKKVKFNNKYWLVQHEYPYTTVSKINENKTINPLFKEIIFGDNIVEIFKNAVLRANDYYDKPKDIDLLNAWDGDMDKWRNKVLIIQGVDHE